MKDNLCRYRATRPIQTQLGRDDSALTMTSSPDSFSTHTKYKHGGRVLTDNSKMSLINQFLIGPVSGPQSAVLAQGLRPRANTADLGPVIWPVRYYLINNIIV